MCVGAFPAGDWVPPGRGVISGDCLGGERHSALRPSGSRLHARQQAFALQLLAGLTTIAGIVILDRSPLISPA